MGGVTYMPLRLAWASTVHKAQGLTLDEVQLSVANHFWEQPGMCYVALSRARTAGGLKIVGSKELLAKRIQADKRLGEWL
jgi:ATP-dependent exoDNAse (exonuclease V) alpha subunit